MILQRISYLSYSLIWGVPQEGTYYLTHDIKEGITVKGTDNDFTFNRPSLQSYAIHIEYHYLDRGAFLELADMKDVYFIYPLNKADHLTKIHFAIESIYDHLKSKFKQL